MLFYFVIFARKYYSNQFSNNHFTMKLKEKKNSNFLLGKTLDQEIENL